MFFIFGLRSKVDRSGVVTEVCRNCGNQAAQVITRRSTTFTLFFIPLIPVGPATGMRASVPPFQGGGEGPRWEGRQGLSSALDRVVLLLDVLTHGS
jgi:hypothetical protein